MAKKQNIEEFLFDRVNQIAGELAISISTRKLIATGELLKSIQVFRRNEGREIVIGVTARKYLGALEFGRKPTKRSQGGVLYKAIVKWLKAKGLSKKLNAWAVTNKIHKEGIKVPNKFNRGGVVSSVITQEKVNLLRKEVNQKFKQTIKEAFSEVLRKKVF